MPHLNFQFPFLYIKIQTKLKDQINLNNNIKI